MRACLITGIAWCCITLTYGQGLFNAVYPIGDCPNIGYKTSMVPELEKLVFEANPILRMPLYNNIRSNLMNGKGEASTLYFGFRPQLRMYTDNSLPVKTPSYKISILGFQKLFRLKNDDLFAFSVESGHYSNGQAKCAFNKDIDDDSPACDSVYQLISSGTNLTDALNRESGNFSTNYTEIILNYRIIGSLNEDYVPTSTLSIRAGWNRYHDRLLFVANLGGFSDDDIEIYGRNRFIAGAEYFTTLPANCWFRKKFSFDRVSINGGLEYISRSHDFVKPLRAELTLSAYLDNNLGIFLSGITGHDNYNFRFVDSGTQIFAGVSFDIFPPIEIK